MGSRRDRTAPTAKILSQHSSRLRTEEPAEDNAEDPIKTAFVEQEPYGPQGPSERSRSEKKSPCNGSHWRSPLKLQTGSLWEGPGSDWLRWTAAGFNGKGKVLSGWVERATDLYLRLVWKSKQWWKQVSLNNRGTPKRWNGQTPSVVVAHKPETLKRLWLILSVTG